MAEVGGGGMSPDAVAALIAASLVGVQLNVSNLQNAGSSFVGSGAYMPVADLLTNFPAAAATLGKYARVNDLWGSARSVMVCEQDSSGYYWRPQRTDYAPAPVSMATGTLTLTPLITAPVLNMVGTLSGSINVTPSSTNVWPGATFTISSNSALGIFGINIGGLVGGGTVPLLTGGIRTITYFSGTGWKAS